MLTNSLHKSDNLTINIIEEKKEKSIRRKKYRRKKYINEMFEMINMIQYKLFDHKTHKKAGQK